MKRYILNCLFTVAVLSAALYGQWSAQWIWQSEDGPDNTWLCVRKTASLSAEPSAAPTRIAAENKYWLFINGEPAVRDGGMDVRPDLENTYYDSLDISPWLQAGENTIAALVWYKGGNNGYSQRMVDKGGFLFEADVIGAAPEKIVSDESWKIMAHSSFASTQQQQQWNAWKWVAWPVVYDARNDPGEWTEASFNDASWISASVKGTPPVSPWNELKHRTIPLWKDQGKSGYLNQSDLPSEITENSTITAETGKNIQGYAYLKIDAPAGVVIRIRMNEFYTHEYITREGVQEFTTQQWQNTSGIPWSKHCVEYDFSNVTGTVSILDLKFHKSSYNTDFAGQFACSNSRLNTLWEKCRTTSLVCMRDIFYDCPDRERSQWWGDVSEQILYSFYLFDQKASLLAKKGLRELMNTQKPDGSLYTTAPGTDFHLPDQNLAAVASLWDYFLYTGDSTLVQELYPAVERYIRDYVAKTRNSDGILILQDVPWNWIDWGSNLDVQIRSANTVVNGLFVKLMDAVKGMAGAAGSEDDIPYYQQMQDSVRSNFNAYFWNDDRECYVFHNMDGTQSSTVDDRSNAWALLAGVVDKAKVPGVMNILNTQQDASPYQERYIEDAMFKINRDSDAISRMLSYYQPDIDSWSTTMWERMGDNGTNNHAWAASPCYLLGAFVAGIVPTGPGFSTCQVLPHLAGLDTVHQIVSTPHGSLSVTHRNYAYTYELDLVLPQPSIAVVGIPQREDTDITKVMVDGSVIWKNGSFTDPDNGMTLSDIDNNYFRLSVPAGSWEISAEYDDTLPPANLALGEAVSSSGSLETSDWGASMLTDGIDTSRTGSKGYTSDPFYEDPDHDEWVEIDLGFDLTFNRVILCPRTDITAADGITAPGFPEDFSIQVKSEGSDYTTIKTLTNQTTTQYSPVTYDMEDQTARYLRIYATKLGQPAGDDAGRYRLQLAEIKVLFQPDATFSQKTSNISSNRYFISVINSGSRLLKIHAREQFLARIIDTRGRVISRYKGMGTSLITLDKSETAAGIYFVDVTTENLRFTRKIMLFD